MHTTKKYVASAALAFSAIAGASAPIAIAQPSSTVTVDGRDYAVCAVEDCSDQPGQIGVWTSKRTGLSYLIIGENQTYPITR